MGFNKIELFITLAETLNYSRTAELKHISQPAVTKAIKNLEDELQVSLFTRDKRLVILTEAGKTFYEDCKSITNLMNLAITRAQTISMHSQANLTIGYTGTSFEMNAIPYLIQEYKKYDNKISFNLINSNHTVLKQQLSDNLCDIVFLTKDDLGEYKNVRFEPIMEGHFVCVLPRSHRLALKDCITIEELNGEQIVLFNSIQAPPLQSKIQDEIKRICRNSKFNYADSIVLGYALIKGNIGLGIMPSFVTTNDDNWVSIPLKYDRKPVYGIAVRKDFPKDIASFIINVIRALH